MADLPSTFVKGFHNEDAVRKMTYHKLGRTGLMVSKLSLGGGTLHPLYGWGILEFSDIYFLNKINYNHKTRLFKINWFLFQSRGWRRSNSCNSTSNQKWNQLHWYRSVNLLKLFKIPENILIWNKNYIFLQVLWSRPFRKNHR